MAVVGLDHIPRVEVPLIDLGEEGGGNLSFFHFFLIFFIFL